MALKTMPIAKLQQLKSQVEAAISGGITGVMPPPTGGTARPGSIPAGGQITPFDRDSRSLRFALPVVSPGAGGGKPRGWR
jgi:hypothetical protein